MANRMMRDTLMVISPTNFWSVRWNDFSMFGASTPKAAVSNSSKKYSRASTTSGRIAAPAASLVRRRRSIGTGFMRAPPRRVRGRTAGRTARSVARRRPEYWPCSIPQTSYRRATSLPAHHNSTRRRPAPSGRRRGSLAAGLLLGPPAGLAGERHRGELGLHHQLGQDRADVGSDRGERDVLLVGDLLGRLAADE